MPSSGVQTCALDRKSTRLNSSHTIISYAVFCLKKNNFIHLFSDTLFYDMLGSLSGECSMWRWVSTLFVRVSALQLVGPVIFVLLFFFFNNGDTPEIYFFPLPDVFPI